MKIQCDMCEKQEASVYCTADEASLCHGCDRRVHHANKLASKHPRFSLNSSSDQPPRCDICQDKRAFLFCKEDRAILCRQCDMSIHGANEHTQYHSRFLLADVKLSGSSSCYDSSSDQTAICSTNSNGSNNFSENNSRMSSVVSEDQKTRGGSVNNHCDSVSHDEGFSIAPNSISDYLMDQTFPEWHVEEFLDPCPSHSYGFYEGYDSGRCTLPVMAHDVNTNQDLGTLWSEDLGILVNSTATMGSQNQKSKRGGLSKRQFYNEVDSFEKLNSDQNTFNSSSIKRPRQLW